MIVPATFDLLNEYYEGHIPFTSKAWVYLEDGKPIGVGGFMYVRKNVRIIYSEAKPGVLETHKLATMKFGRFMMKIADENGWTLIALADENLPTAPSFLQHFGFKPNENGEYVRWPE